MLVATTLVVAVAAAAALGARATCTSVPAAEATCGPSIGGGVDGTCDGLAQCTVALATDLDNAQALNPDGTVCFDATEDTEAITVAWSCTASRLTVSFGEVLVVTTTTVAPMTTTAMPEDVNGTAVNATASPTATPTASPTPSPTFTMGFADVALVVTCRGKLNTITTCTSDDAAASTAVAIQDEVIDGGVPVRTLRFDFTAASIGALSGYGAEFSFESLCPLFAPCTSTSTVTTKRLVGKHAAFSSEGAAEWHSVAVVDMAANADAGGELTLITLDKEGETTDDGLRAFTATNSVGGVYTVTAFWASNLRGVDHAGDANGGGHFHVSDQCDLSCDGERYEQHHRVAGSSTDRQGVHITYVNNDGEEAEFQLAYITYRNAEADAPLELCVGDEDAREFGTFDQWAACSTLQSIDDTQYVSEDACCRRVVFGCVFAEPAIDGDESASVTDAVQQRCLYDQVVIEGTKTRDAIIAARQGGNDADAALNATEQASAALAADFNAFSDAFAALVDDTEAKVRAAVWKHFDALGVVAEVAGNDTRRAAADATTSLSAAFVTDQNRTRAEVGQQAAAIEALVTSALGELEEQAELVANVTASVIEANEQTATNIELVQQLTSLLNNLPTDLNAETIDSVDFAEKQLLVGLFQLKARLADMDFARKDLLDELKSELTVQRIKLERNNQLIRRWEGSDGEWTG